MDFKNKSALLQSLLDRYWKAETSLEEEGRLKESLSKEKGDLSPSEFQYFKNIKQFSELELSPDFEQRILLAIDKKESLTIRQLFFRHASKIAASLLLLVASMAGFSYWTAQEQAKELATKEAFETAKQSLLLMSAKLNKGTTATTYKLSKFTTTQQKIKRISSE